MKASSYDRKPSNMRERPRKLKKYRVWLEDGASMMVDGVNAMHAQTIARTEIKRLFLGTIV